MKRHAYVHTTQGVLEVHATDLVPGDPIVAVIERRIRQSDPTEWADNRLLVSRWKDLDRVAKVWVSARIFPEQVVWIEEAQE